MDMPSQPVGGNEALCHALPRAEWYDARIATHRHIWLLALTSGACMFDWASHDPRQAERVPCDEESLQDTPGDCRMEVCGAGTVISQPDDDDVPDDGSVCTVDSCEDGEPVHTPVETGTACGDMLVCDDAGRCVGCASPSDCPVPRGICEAATCVEGVCGVGPAADGTPCPGDGVFCNGEEICSGGSCMSPGDPCDGVDGDDDCSEMCDEQNADCNGLDPNDAPCDDGLWCNGTDRCNPNGACVKHDDPPCDGPDGDGNCSESCDERTDTCGHPDLDGSPCSDGLFCNGSESCSAGVCGSSSGNPCPGPDGDGDCSETCNEDANSCTANDPDGSDCNGIVDNICCAQGSCITTTSCL